MLLGFPVPYPDETFYSLLARYQLHSNKIDIKHTLKALYGHTSDRANHFFISENVPLFDGFAHMNQSPEDFIYNHTILPFYSAFIPQYRVQLIIRNLIQNNEYDIHKELGLDDERQLKHCPICMNEDISTYGETYWHRIHQIPSVLVCPKHKANLLVVSKNNSNRGLLPASQANLKNEIEFRFTNQTFNQLYFFAQEAEWLLSQRIKMLDLDSYKEKYIKFLQQNDMASLFGRVKHNKLFQFFKDHYTDELLEALESSVTPHNSWLQLALGNQKKMLDPIKHLLIIKLMSNGMQEFLAKDFTFHPFGDGPWTCYNPAHEHYKEKVITRLELTTHDETEKIIGTFKCHCGFTYSRSGFIDQDFVKLGPVKVIEYGATWREKLLQLNARGVPFNDIGIRLGITPKAYSTPTDASRELSLREEI